MHINTLNAHTQRHTHTQIHTHILTALHMKSVLMIRFRLYSDIMSDHVQFELTFTKVGTIYDASIDSTHTVMAQIILVSY